MRLRHIKGCEEFVNNSEWTITDPKANKGSWQHPIHVEIGLACENELSRQANNIELIA